MRCRNVSPSHTVRIRSSQALPPTWRPLGANHQRSARTGPFARTPTPRATGPCVGRRWVRRFAGRGVTGCFCHIVATSFVYLYVQQTDVHFPIFNLHILMGFNMGNPAVASTTQRPSPPAYVFVPVRCGDEKGSPGFISCEKNIILAAWSFVTTFQQMHHCLQGYGCASDKKGLGR